MSTYQIDQRIVPSTLDELLRWRAQHQPERRAFTFLRQDHANNAQLTYAELDRRARIIAATLQMVGVAGKPVLLLHPPSLEYIAAFFGCLYAEAIAVPAYPPHSVRTMPRIQAIAEDTQAETVLTTADILGDLQRGFLHAPDLQRLYWIATDRLDGQLADEWREPGIDGSALAFLQYTSGSTGMPKGVMVSHSNLLHNLGVLSRHCQQTPDGHVVSWLPPYHDLGLICGILYPFYTGCPASLMSPVTFLQRPFRWLQAISTAGATMSMAPNFAYDLCCSKITPEQLATLDLRSWELTANGGEPVRKETMDRFVSTFGPCGFRAQTFFPGYGMAETTLVLATSKKAHHPVVRSFQQEALKQNRVARAENDEQDAQPIVGYQELPPEQTVIIVNPETQRRCEPDEIGEIWVAGPSVTQGYWRKPEETQHIFQAYTAHSGEGPFLRTGDLGFINDEVLYITGRAKDLIIIRGRNYYPQDIEQTVERTHFAIRPGCCVAFSQDVEGSEQLVVLVEIDPRYHPSRHHNGSPAAERKVSSRPLNPQDVIKAIRAAVSEEHELYTYRIMLLKAGSILKTSSGKLQRRACRSEFLAERLRVWDE